MSDTVTARLPLMRWQGARGTYHLVTFTGEMAEALSMLAALHRLKSGRQRGFGSIKLKAQIGDTVWKTSVFPQKAPLESADKSGADKRYWMLLINKAVMRAEGLAQGDPVPVTLAL
jgi:hypothetical protein